MSTHHSAPREIDATNWRALHDRTDALLVTEAGDEPILGTLYDEDEGLIVRTASGDHFYLLDETVTVRMPMTTFAAIRAAAGTDA